MLHEKKVGLRLREKQKYNLSYLNHEYEFYKSTNLMTNKNLTPLKNVSISSIFFLHNLSMFEKMFQKSSEISLEK